MDDENQDSSGATGLAPCPTCGSAPDAPALTDWDGNSYSHALPMQLLGSIDVSLARRADGSGHAVVESATGMPLVTGQTAQGTWDAAQDIAAQLGRRRVQAAIDQGIADAAGRGAGGTDPALPDARDLVTRRGPNDGGGGSAADPFSSATLTRLPSVLQRTDEIPPGGYPLMQMGAAPGEALDPQLYASKGKAYAGSQVVQFSHYNDDIVHADGGPAGDSRRAGDASPDTQRKAMQAIVSAGKTAGMSDDQIALTLAIARHESGFNPDAAAGTTSASGLGQFTDQTGAHYGLDSNNRWDVGAQASALVQHTLDNMQRAQANGHDGADLDRYTYAYHHDGPSLKYGGLGIADKSVVPLVGLYRGSVGNLGSQDEH